MRDVALSFTCAQTNNLFGKLLMWTTFAGVAFIRTTKDLDQYKELLKEVRCLHTAHWRALRSPSLVLPTAGHLLRQAVVRHVGGR